MKLLGENIAKTLQNIAEGMTTYIRLPDTGSKAMKKMGINQAPIIWHRKNRLNTVKRHPKNEIKSTNHLCD